MDNSGRADEFVKLMAMHQRRVYAYILTLVPNRSDADDLLQQTCTVLWSKFESFDSGTNFAAWACRVAHLEVLAFRRRKPPTVNLGDDLCDAISKRTLARGFELDLRYEAMAICVEQLRDGDRDLLQRRYSAGASVTAVAKQIGRPVQGLYKAYHRIQHGLLECIQRRLEREEHRGE